MGSVKLAFFDRIIHENPLNGDLPSPDTGSSQPLTNWGDPPSMWKSPTSLGNTMDYLSFTQVFTGYYLTWPSWTITSSPLVVQNFSFARRGLDIGLIGSWADSRCFWRNVFKLSSEVYVENTVYQILFFHFCLDLFWNHFLQVSIDGHL